MKGTTWLLLLILPLYALPQNAFLRIYPQSNGLESFNDLVQVSANEYAFITESTFYRVDNQGRILLEKVLQEGQSSFLESLATDQAGNCYIAGQVFNAVSDPHLKCWKLDRNGQVLASASLATGSTHRLRIVPAANNRLFFTYIQPGGNRLKVLLLDDQCHERWKQELSHQLSNDFMAHATPDGQAEFLFITAGDHKTWLAQVNAMGQLTQKEILLPQPAVGRLYTRNFCRTPDGGYAFTGETIPDKGLSDALFYKTDKDGNLQWKQEINIHRADRFMSVAATTDGYVLLAGAGYEKDRASETAGDVVLVKADWQGHLQWKKALGSARADHPSHLLLPDAGSILVGGRISYPGEVVPVTMLCKTDQQGNLPAGIPFQPTPPNTFTRIQVQDDAPVQKLVKALPAPDGSMIAAGNFQNRTDHEVYPFLVGSDKTGQAAWHKKITALPGILRALANTRDGHYIGLIEQRGFLSTNFLTLVKFTGQGDTLWTSFLYTTTLRDIVATSDGGYLLAGAEDLTLSDFDIILVKTDANGKELWRKKTGISARWETARRIKETPEGDFIIAGNAQVAFGSTSGAYALKVNKDGQVLWSKTFDAGIAVNLLYDVAITPDGYIMAGSTAPGASDKKDILLIRLNKKGDKLWEKTYDLHLQDEAFTVYYTSDDTLLVAGNTGEPAAGHLEKYGFLMKLNKEGNQQNIQYFGKAGVQTSAEAVWVQGHEVVLAGSTQDEYGEGHMYFTKAGTASSATPPAATSLTVYPNPAYSKIFISMKNNYNGPVNIVIYNTTGQQVMVLQRNKASIELKEEIPLNGLASGMYYFFIQQGNDKTAQSIRVINR